MSSSSGELDLNELTYRCVESHLSDLKNISALDVVEITDVDLSDSEVDAIIENCGRAADHLQRELERVDIAEMIQ